ncbi:hypothetical protein [Lysinibacillus sp. 38-6]|jgi:hypothetical protein|uniref:hypothetical protein n=1 Tax=Lysinibacillus sp. 38-6 TaxID=3385991 RepID=UPI0039088E7D
MLYRKVVMKILREPDYAQRETYLLKLEQDYELRSLYHAIKTNDPVERERSKKRLKEIHGELEYLSLPY